METSRRQLLHLPILPVQVDRGRRVATDTQDDVIAEPRELVLVTSPLQMDLHLADRRKPLLQRSEEGRVDDQFLLFGHVAFHPLFQLRPGDGRVSLVQLDGSVVGLEQGKAAHVAHENEASGSHGLHGALQYSQEVLDAGEVLNHRVEDDDVERARRHAVEVVGRLLSKTDLR